jgi:hypothetical protein
MVHLLRYQALEIPEMQTIPQSIAAAKGMLVMLLKDGDTIGSWCAV